MSVVQTPILSPCIGICALDEQGYCEGCFRTGAEIAGWIGFSPGQRDYLMQFVLPRRAQEATGA